MNLTEKLINILTEFFLDGSGLLSLLSLVTLFGMAGIFRKASFKWHHIILPWDRYYTLAKCAFRENEGKVLAVSIFISSVVDIFNILIMDTRTSQMLTIEGLGNPLMLIIFPLQIIILVYKIRVFSSLCDVYGRSRKWMWLWLLIPPIPFVLWGWNRNFNPKIDYEDVRQDVVESYRVGSGSAIEEGLSVRLEHRVVYDFFSKKYLLKNINMDIAPGHMVLLLGGSGAGKTTLVNAINGYEPAKAEILLDGHNIYTEYRKMIYEIGYVPQQELMRPKDSVYNTLNDASLLRMPAELSDKDREERISEVMKIFGLTRLRNRPVEVLSGGQKKRLSIAMEYLSNPSLFILDEPDSGLDGVMARELMRNLREIANQGKIVIVITHTPDRVIDLFDDVIVLARDREKCGRLAWFGPVKEAKKFFEKESMEEIVLSINSLEEGGEGRAEEFINRFAGFSENKIQEVSE
ncbi:MAG: ABC transporter ATP-binding protein [Sphaerochaetaceae bacterium]|nr:ABC transporter ATP-binding protein [Sphaerochaetaceae bacterium]